MCKIMIVPGAKNVENLWKFVEIITPKISVSNSDGLGYAAIDKKGRIFSERWLTNKNAFKEYGLSEGDKLLYSTLGPDAVKEKFTEEYNRYGEIKKNEVVSLLLHARMATGDVNIKNTHPFVTQGTALIHNGVIRNHEKFEKTLSTCDSEALLSEYLSWNVSDDIKQINGLVEAIRGYYACGVLTKDKNGNPILDLFKSQTASLYVTYVNELSTVVFCTSKFDLETSIKDLKWESNRIFEVEKDQFFRFDAITGEKLEHLKISPNEYYNEYYQSNYNKDDKKDLDNFEEVVTHYQKKVDWVNLIEEEEIKRLNNGMN